MTSRLGSSYDPYHSMSHRPGLPAPPSSLEQTEGVPDHLTQPSPSAPSAFASFRGVPEPVLPPNRSNGGAAPWPFGCCEKPVPATTAELLPALQEVELPYCEKNDARDLLEKFLKENPISLNYTPGFFRMTSRGVMFTCRIQMSNEAPAFIRYTGVNITRGATYLWFDGDENRPPIGPFKDDNPNLLEKLLSLGRCAQINKPLLVLNDPENQYYPAFQRVLQDFQIPTKLPENFV